MNYLEQIFAQQIDFKFDKKTNRYLIQRLNSNSAQGLYKDGRYRTTSKATIQQQVNALV